MALPGNQPASLGALAAGFLAGYVIQASARSLCSRLPEALEKTCAGADSIRWWACWSLGLAMSFVVEPVMGADQYGAEPGV